MMMDAEARAQATEAMLLAQEIGALLKGRGPEVQGAALLDLVSMYFAGHHPIFREQALTAWIDALRKIIPESEKEIGDPWREVRN